MTQRIQAREEIKGWKIRIPVRLCRLIQVIVISYLQFLMSHIHKKIFLIKQNLTKHKIWQNILQVTEYLNNANLEKWSFFPPAESSCFCDGNRVDDLSLLLSFHAAFDAMMRWMCRFWVWKSEVKWTHLGWWLLASNSLSVGHCGCEAVSFQLLVQILQPQKTQRTCVRKQARCCCDVKSHVSHPTCCNSWTTASSLRPEGEEILTWMNALVSKPVRIKRMD